ncbi:MAG: glucose-6-phosphate isomerase, partial [Phaeodactylibacter sp.]|nr:glucose-6-phosphate isomerase [Phaeodactylibacter sp.]
MKTLRFDYTKALGFVKAHELEFLQAQIDQAAELLEKGSGQGNEFLGWVNWPEQYDKEEFARVEAAAKRIQEQSEVLVVIGIGGSYLGAKAAIEFLGHAFRNDLPKEQRKGPAVYFAGINISGTYLSQLLEVIGDRDFSINVISKSGTTTEPAIAFRVLKKKLEEKYGKAEAKNRIYATTDRQKGALKKLADQEGYDQFVVPDDVGGRFSVLTAVGLLPIAAAGFDIRALMAGAASGMAAFSKPFAENPCYQYVAVRNALYRKQYAIEMLVNYEPRLFFIAEWWKQLFGESEGKDGKGIFPASASFTTDLHSLGQYVQDGLRTIFETVLQIDTPEVDMVIESDPANLDGLNYLSGKGMDEVNKKR